MINNNYIESGLNDGDWETVIDFREINQEGISLEELLSYL